jgi:hypothetical protein
MLVLIDKDWLTARDKQGRNRLEMEGDYVRMEIEAGLKRDIPITPILLQGAQVPTPEELPEAIRALAYRNGFEVSHSRWESDVREMSRRLKLERSQSQIQSSSASPASVPSQAPTTHAQWPTRRKVALAAVVTAVAGGLGSIGYRSSKWEANENNPSIAEKGRNEDPPKPASARNSVPTQSGSSAQTQDAQARPDAISTIAAIADQSALVSFQWRDRSKVPAGYIKGMALVYARAYCKLKSGNAAALEMAKASTGDMDRDALAWYAEQFSSIGMNNAFLAVSTLRQLFVLLIGLGVRESDGNYCQGMDPTVRYGAAQTADAGLFSTTYNSMMASPLLAEVFKYYLTRPLGFEDIFSEGAKCSTLDLQTLGANAAKAPSDTERFQQLSKGCPAFAAEYAAIGLRNIRKHWGPINRREVELVPECDAMLRQVQVFVDSSPNIDAVLL